MVEHTTAGLRELVAFLGRHGVGEVAIERPDGPVIDTLLERRPHRRGDQPEPGQEPPRPLRVGWQQGRPIRRLRPGRHPAHRPGAAASAGPRHRGHHGAARACRARKDLIDHRVAAANQLRAHLRNVFPGAVGLFADIDSEITLAFLTRFDTQDRADWLTAKRLGDWLAKLSYTGRTDPAVLHHRLLDAPRGATGEHAASASSTSPRAASRCCSPCSRAAPRGVPRPWRPAARLCR